MTREVSVIGKSGSRETLMDEGLVTTREAAEFLGIGLTRVYELMNTGQIAYCKIGRSRRIPRKALIRFCEEVLQGGNQRPAA